MKHFGKSAIAMLLVLVFMVGMIPTSAFASEPEAAEAHTEHSWDDWVVTAEPSCTEKGSQERSCSVCGETETEPIPALGHSFSSVTAFVKHEAGVIIESDGNDDLFLGEVIVPSTGWMKRPSQSFSQTM